MLLRSTLGKFFAPTALITLLGVVAGGCGGCDDSSLVCDEDGLNCQICDAYGCHDANPGTSTTESSGTSTQVGGTGASGAEGGAGGTSPAGSGGAGGSVACDQEITTCPCSDSAECASGTQCIGKLCVPGCDFSYECGAGKVCANGACVTACGDTAPCPQNGYKCDKGVCIPDPLNPQCSETNPCEVATNLCVDGFCTTACATNADCQVGDICNASTGSCIPDPSPKPVCSDTTMCTGAGQQCGDDGYCHYPCATTDECKLIADQFVKCDVVCKTQEEVSPECSLDKPCPMGQDCISNECL